MSQSAAGYARRLAETALSTGAIKLNPDQPFTWASGYRMPVYNDNRLLLGDAAHRRLIAEGLEHVLRENALSPEVIAGTATAGIPHATTLADLLRVPLIYVRSQAKGHGLKNQVEGPLRAGQVVVVVEDLVSTGGSVLNAVEAVRSAGGRVGHCLCIFNYGFAPALEEFKRHECQLRALLTFDGLLLYGEETGRLSAQQLGLLRSWQAEPFAWGDRHGFPRKV